MPPANIVPDFLLAPIEKRAHFMHAVLGVPFHPCRQGAARRLTTPDSRHPGTPARERASKWLDFADTAALAPLLQPFSKTVDAVRAHPLFQSFRLRIVKPQFAREAFLQAPHQIVGLWKQASRVDAEDLDFRYLSPDQVSQNDRFGSEAVRVANILVLRNGET